MLLLPCSIGVRTTAAAIMVFQFLFKRRKKYTIFVYIVGIFSLIGTFILYDNETNYVKSKVYLIQKFWPETSSNTADDYDLFTNGGGGAGDMSEYDDIVYANESIYGKNSEDFPNEGGADNGGLFDSLPCQLPELDFDIKYNDSVPNPPCKYSYNWGELVSGRWLLRADVKSRFTYLKCSYRAIFYVNDFKFSVSGLRNLVDNQEITDDVIEVFCKAMENRRVLKFDNLYPQILNNRVKSTDSGAAKSPGSSSINKCKPMNIMLISYDSISKVAWINRLPKTTKFLKEVLNSTILDGYNIVGDGTPAALIPIYTGRTEEELPSALKNDPKGKYVDEVYPFIWKELHNHGYMSMHVDDWPHIGAFTYRMRGFKDHAPKYYLKQYQLRLWQRFSRAYFANKDDFCTGAKKRHQNVLDLFEQFLAMYNQSMPTISLMHYVENSHDSSSRVDWLDSEILGFLQRLFANKLLENTALFLYSDHGARFSNKKSSPKRYLEERMPFFSLYLPNSYRQANPDKYQHLLDNSKRLTSPFDIYATVRELTCLNNNEPSGNSGIQAAAPSNTKQRSISLLSPISSERNCEHIGISDHFCTCVKPWHKADPSDSQIIQAANTSIKFINFITKDVKQLCVRLKLREIITAESLSSTNTAKSDLLRIQFITSPNNGTYETLLRVGYVRSYKFKSKLFSIRSRDDISRIDAYGDQPHCVSNFENNPAYLVDIRKFCFCKPKQKKAT